MQKPDTAAVADANQDGLLDLASVRLRTLLSESDSAPNTTLDSVMKRLFDPRERDLVTVSAFGSSL
jgi:hypothetical protein